MALRTLELMDVTSVICQAQVFAFKAHKSLETRTVSGIARPQVMHLQEVADLVWAFGGTDQEVAAAWLHDALEDTPVQLKEIQELFGPRIADIVVGLTDYKEYAQMPLAQRKQMQADRVRTEPGSTQFVKLADQVSNVQALVLDRPCAMSPSTCRTYIEGARLVAEQCQGVNTSLFNLFLDVHTRALMHFNDALQVSEV